jgi:hypothetical protein
VGCPTWVPCGLIVGKMHGLAASGLPDLGPMWVNSGQDGKGCKWAAHNWVPCGLIVGNMGWATRRQPDLGPMRVNSGQDNFFSYRPNYDLIKIFSKRYKCVQKVTCRPTTRP